MWDALAVSRCINIGTSLLTGAILIRIAWRSAHLLRFDFYGHPHPVSNWQFLARYGCGAALIYWAYLSAVALAAHTPGGSRIIGLSVILTGLLVSVIGWQRETKPRPFVRPLINRMRRRHR